MEKDIVNEITNYIEPIDEDILNEISNKEVRKLVVSVINKLKTFDIDLSKKQQMEMVKMIGKSAAEISWV